MDQTIPVSATRQTRNNWAEIWDDSGMIFCRFGANIEMDLEIAKQCVKMRLDFQQGQVRHVLIDMTGLRSATREARGFMAKEGSEGIRAGALIISSPVSRIIGNIFLSLNRPLAPARLFTDWQLAIEWLKQHN